MKPKREPASINKYTQNDHEIVKNPMRKMMCLGHQKTPRTGRAGGLRRRRRMEHNIYISYSYDHTSVYVRYILPIDSFDVKFRALVKIKRKPQTIVLNLEIRTDTKCIRHDVIKETIDQNNLSKEKYSHKNMIVIILRRMFK